MYSCACLCVGKGMPSVLAIEFVITFKQECTLEENFITTRGIADSGRHWFL